MPIIYNNEPKKPEPKRQSVRSVVEVESVDSINTNNYDFDINKTYLVVNGKVKEISPKSKYLLDMLITE